MEFELTREQKLIKKAARDFAENEFQNVLEYDREEKFPFEIWKKACELGFIGVGIEEKYNGPGLSIVESALIVEEFSRVDPAIAQVLIACTFGYEILQRYGTEDQKERYLSRLPVGEAIMATAITEPNAGSDVSAISTKAVPEGDGFLINGSKVFISCGNIADYILVVCRTSFNEEKKHRGLSLFIVEKGTKGFKSTKMTGKLGIRCSDTAELSFSNVWVPKENLVGEVNKGFYYLMEFLTESRVITAAQAVGLAQGALEKSINYARSREQFGKKIGEFQGIQFKIAEMATRVEAARLLTYKAAWLISKGNPSPALSSMAKWYAAETAVRVAEEAVEIHGGYGVMSEYTVEKFYRDAKVTEIYEGTKEIQKIIIAKELLKSL